MKVLFIGGTGIISSACSPLAIESGMELYLLNRGKSSRETPKGAKTIHADIRDPESVKKAIKGHQFDAVVDWIAFHTSHIETDIELFRGKTKQFVFISSASAYQTPAVSLPITESTVLDNPYWEYSRNKIACEERLIEAYRTEKFPITIVRPSHTYDQRLLPFDHGYTVIDRMKRGKPVVVHGDGSSLWTMTHHRDFAKGFVPLLGLPAAIGEAIQITSDEWLTWNQIYEIMGQEFGCVPKLVHVPSDLIARHDDNWGSALLGDKANSSIFDNSKLKKLVPSYRATIPFAQGAREIAAWYEADSARQVVNPAHDELENRLIALMES